MKDRFGTSLWIALAAAVMAALFLPAAASAAWSPIAPTPGFSGERPSDLRRLDTSDGGKLLYWHREVGGFDTVQALRFADDGTPGPIFNVSDGTADFGSDLEAVIDSDGEVTFAWLSNATPNNVVRAVSVPLAGPIGPVEDISPAGGPGETVEHMSMAVAPDGTVGYTWRRFDGVLWQVEGVTVPDAGPIGTVRAYTSGPYDVRDPGLGSTSSNGFTLAWIADNLDSGFSNIATININNDGSEFTVKIEDVDVPVDPVYEFPWTKPVRVLDGDTCKPLIDPITDEPVFADTGAAGNPRSLKVGGNGSFRINFAWIRDTVVTNDDPCTGDPIEVLASQTAVETSGFGSFGEPLPVTRITPLNVDISNLRFQNPPSGRATLSWLADNDGSYASQLYRISSGALWNLAIGPDPLDPTVAVAENGAMGVGWTDEGLTAVAQAAIITRRKVLRPVDLPGLGTLKSSSEMLADPGTLGRHSVLFFGVDLADNTSFYTSSFTDPGIAISPSSVEFGVNFLNLPRPSRPVYVTNSGTTPTEVTSVAVTGPGTAEFSLAAPSGCLGELVPGGSCRIAIAFSPAAAGGSSATLEVQTDAGDVSSSLSGTGVARTRMGLQIKPRQRTVRAGGRAVFRAVVNNRGGIATTGAAVCMAGARGALSPGRRCVTIGSLAAGATRSINFPVRAKRTARPAAYPISFRLRATNTRSRRGRVTLRVRR